METLGQFYAKEAYREIESMDKLNRLRNTINWNKFRRIVANAYRDNDTTGGRPHTDELVIVRALVLQSIYNLSDPELEFQCNDRISFRNFLGLPEKVPDFTTIWDARERLSKAGLDKKIWAELQRQLDAKGFEIRKGIIQDATFVEAERGKVSKTADGERKRKESSHMDKDGTFSVKGGQIHFGYKTHARLDVKHKLVRSVEVTTASVHDSRVDLAEEGDGKAYRDKGYFGRPPFAEGGERYDYGPGSTERPAHEGAEKTERPHSEDTFAGRAAVCRGEERLRRLVHAGQDLGAGGDKGAVQVFLLQPVSYPGAFPPSVSHRPLTEKRLKARLFRLR